jgi:hypothetical protein
MYGVLTYPLDVIKVNRIVQSSFARENGENLPRELVSLYERGLIEKGLYRGFVFGMVGAIVATTTQSIMPFAVMAGAAGAILANPLAVL